MNNVVGRRGSERWVTNLWGTTNRGNNWFTHRNRHRVERTPGTEGNGNQNCVNQCVATWGQGPNNEQNVGSQRTSVEQLCPGKWSTLCIHERVVAV